MGRVFSWKSIAEGEIPSLSSYDEVRDILQIGVLTAPIIGEIVCGSVLLGTHSIRSDLDCFILYEKSREREAFSYMHGIVSMAQEYFVPISFLPCDSKVAKTKMHHVGESFREHLERSIELGGCIGDNPLDHISEGMGRKKEIRTYLSYKMYGLIEKFAEYPRLSEEARLLYIKKLLESPMHVARKVLSYHGPLENDSKAFVQEMYPRLMPDWMRDRFTNLLLIDRIYEDALSGAIDSSLSEDEYEEVLAEIIGRTEDFLEFVRANIWYIDNAARK